MTKLRAALLRLEDRYAPGLEQWHPVSLVLISVLLCVLLAGLLAAYAVMPSWRAWQAADRRLAELEAQTAIPASALGDLKRIEEDIAHQIEILGVVPRGPAAGAVALERIRALGVSAGLPRIEIKLLGDPSTAAKDGLGFAVELEGSYARLGAWLDRAPRELPWLELRRVELAGGEKGATSVAMKYHGVLPAELLGEGP